MITARQHVERARMVLIQEQPFFGFLALHLAIVERPDVGTAATDGEHFFYAPAYVETLTDAELVWLWAHEVGHCAYSHHARIGNRDLAEFNIAADIALNRDLETAMKGRRPAGMVFDPSFDGMGAEEIYAARQAAKRKAKQDAAGLSGAGAPQPGAPGQPSPGNGQQSPQSGQQPGAGASGQPQPGNPGAPGQPSAAAGTQPGNPGAPGQPSAGTVNGFGGIMRPGDGSAAAATESADKWQVLARQAASIAKAQNAGMMPGAAARVIEALSAPMVDYAELLRDLINSRVAVDYSFSRPNRRLIGMGIYMPGIVADAIDHLIFAVDTSGSIDGVMLANAATEIIGAMESGKVRQLTVIFADAAVQAVQEFELGDDIKLVPAGGGGTRFDDTFRWIEANAPDATAIIYLTDMECRHWGEEPAAPVYWAVHGDSRKFDRLAAAAPFGDAVYIGRLG